MLAGQTAVLVNRMKHSIAELTAMVRTGRITAVSLVEVSLEQANANTTLNAFISLDRKRALETARQTDALVAAGGDPGPLCGVPLVIKDNINVAGMRTTAGTPGINFVAKSSAPVVARLQAANAIIIGKTNMHELAFGVTSNNAAFGAVRNPQNPSCFPGGSSGGTAAAISAGIVPAGLGTDTAGSVRLPAALTGIAGLRPTTRCVDPAGIVPSVPSFDVVGPMARDVMDVAYLYGIMTGNPVAARRDVKGLRFGVAKPHCENLSPGVAQAMEATLACLQHAGATLLDVDLSEVVAASFEVGFLIGFHQMKSAMTDFLAQYQPQTQLEEMINQIASKDVKAVYENSVIGEGAPTEADYRTALGRIEGIQREYLRIMQHHNIDAFIFPTAVIEAQSIATSSDTLMINGETAPTLQTYMRNNAATGVCGAPGLTIPIGTGEAGLPVGMELDGRPGGDLELFAIGLGLEAAIASKT